MLSKSTQFFMLGFIMITSTIQTTKTAQTPHPPISVLAQYNLVTIPAIKQLIIATLNNNDDEKNYKNYPSNMHKIQDIFWALKRINTLIKQQQNIVTTHDIAPLEKNLADIQKTNNPDTSKRLLKRQRYIARTLAGLKTNLVIFDSEEVP